MTPAETPTECAACVAHRDNPERKKHGGLDLEMLLDNHHRQLAEAREGTNDLLARMEKLAAELELNSLENTAFFFAARRLRLALEGKS